MREREREGGREIGGGWGEREREREGGREVRTERRSEVERAGRTDVVRDCGQEGCRRQQFKKSRQKQQQKEDKHQGQTHP